MQEKNIFFCIYLLVMPKYWVKNYFAHGRFPEVGQKQKTEKKKKERKKERAKVGDNNGQATHGARKHAWHTQVAWAKKERTMVITMVKLRMAHAWRTHGARMAHAIRLGQKRD